VFILEEHIQNTITIERPFKGPDSSQHPDNLDNVIGKMTAFYSLPALHPKQVRHSTNSLTSQLAANRRKIPQNNTKKQFFSLHLVDLEESDNIMMDIETSSSPPNNNSESFHLPLSIHQISLSNEKTQLIILSACSTLDRA
jgi:hypothetical protein